MATFIDHQKAFISLFNQTARYHRRHCRFNWSTQQLCENMGLRRFFE